VRLRALLLALTSAACTGPGALPPEAQVVLYVDTDAPVVSAISGPSDLTLPIPLFDRVRVEVLTAQCDACSNDFAVSAEQLTSVGQGQPGVSVGIVPPAGSTPSVRVRLYVSRFASASGEPDAQTTLDVTAALPSPGAGQVVEATVFLPTAGVGRPAGADTPVVATPGRPASSQVGRWAPAQRSACDAALSGPGEVCIPGGAFWMGGLPGSNTEEVYPGWRRLVALSPFYLDATEVVVSAFRAGGGRATMWSGSTAGTSVEDWCTYSAAPTSRDKLPVVCVTAAQAAAYCAGLGKVLPSEAQLEYAEGGLRNALCVWGSDTPDCAQSIWGRNGYGLLATELGSECLAKTNTLSPMGGPEPPGHGAYDVLSLGSTLLFDLAGNVSEWAADAYQDRTGSCWSPPGVMIDPVCDATSTQSSFRGGGWTDGANGCVTGSPRATSVGSGDVSLGFRCARRGE